MTKPRTAEQVLRGTVSGGFAKFFERETLAGIFHTAGYRSTRTDERNFHVLGGIELCTMFHGVDQNLLESGYDLVSLGLRDARVFYSTQKLNQAICSSQITSGRQGNPFKCCGKNFYAIVPAGLRHGRTHHFSELGSLEWC